MRQETKSLPEIHIELGNANMQCFNQTMMEAIDQTFSKLGAKIKHTLYSSLEADYKLSKETIPDRIEDFANALEKVFGASAFLLEIDVMKTLRTKVPAFKCEVKDSNLDFSDYVKSLKIFMDAA